MAQDMEGLQRAENALTDLQKVNHSKNIQRSIFLKYSLPRVQYAISVVGSILTGSHFAKQMLYVCRDYLMIFKRLLPPPRRMYVNK